MHQTVALKSKHKVENELEAELTHRLGESSNVINPALAADTEGVADSWQDVVALTGKDLRRLCRAISSWKEPQVRGR